MAPRPTSSLAQHVDQCVDQCVDQSGSSCDEATDAQGDAQVDDQRLAPYRLSGLPARASATRASAARASAIRARARRGALPRLATAVAIAFSLAACGGEGGDSDAPVAGTASSGDEAARSGAVEGAETISGEDVREHLRALSHDSMAGRAPGTEGGEMAAEYIAARFRDAGLEPVAGSYFQEVPMVGSTPLPGSAELTFEDGGTRLEPRYLDDFVVWSGDAGSGSATGEGELVFVGYGIDAPENDWNDYGVDVAGKVVMILVNDPPAPAREPGLFGGPAMTYYGRWTYKFEEAARQGAAAAFVVHSTEEAGYGWNVVRGSWSGEQFALPPDPGGAEPVAVEGWVTDDLAREVLGAAGLDFDELVERAGSRDFSPVETGVRVRTAVRSGVRSVETRNVVAMVRGAERPDEVVVVTSHYDHLGTGEAVAGDSIYNGAYDNASGTALLLEVAEAFARRERAPARSLLFIATGAEEQGLIGASWYVQNPLFPLANTVAEINVDGANLWGETDDLIAMGAERSELGAFVEARARQMGMRLEPDAEPEKGFFFRSDHFPFARAGVPALYLEHGRDYRGRPAGWGQGIQDEYTSERYHAPADEFDPSFTFEGAVQQGRIVYLTALDIAESGAWPAWNEGSEFKAARDAMRPPGG